MVALQILVLIVGVRILLGELNYGWFVYRLRTRDSQSLKMGSTPIPTAKHLIKKKIITFPDCVMVALQILVLIVGVRILLGELHGRLD